MNFYNVKGEFFRGRDWKGWRSQFVSSFAASNEAAAEPWKARFLVAERSRSKQKATQKCILKNVKLDNRNMYDKMEKALKFNSAFFHKWRKTYAKKNSCCNFSFTFCPYGF